MSEAESEPHTPSANEAFYDAEIAPKLAELAKACEDRGMSFLAAVEFDPGQTGSTMALPVGHTFEMRMVAYAIQAHGNIDSMVFGVAKDCRLNNRSHNSIVLFKLGLPMDAEAQ